MTNALGIMWKKLCTELREKADRKLKEQAEKIKKEIEQATGDNGGCCTLS
jgi:hypothetical protein